MYWEVVKGRACDSLQRAQLAEITRLGTELLANGRAIILLERENKALHANLAAKDEQLKDAGRLAGLEKERFKIKIKRLWRVVVIEGGVITLVLVILLL